MDRHGPGGGALHNRGTGAPSHRPRVSSMAPLLSGSSFASSTGDVRDVQSVRSELADQPGRDEPGEAGWDRGDRVPGTVAGGNWLFGPDARPRRRAANLPAGTRRDLEKRNPSPLPASFVRMVAVGATTEHQRRDARRKRALVVAAARAAFAEQGIDVSVDEIVERAGAGYRHDLSPPSPARSARRRHLRGANRRARGGRRARSCVRGHGPRTAAAAPGVAA